MPRTTRLHAPGRFFHATAVTQSRTKWFTPDLRDRIVTYIRESVQGSTSQLIAFAVMPNHLHLIVRQGTQPLGWMMQRVLQRSAWLVRKTYKHEGHVFGWPYWSGMCDDPMYLRQMIIYTHLNPFHASLCTQLHEYPWTSHESYRDFSQGKEDAAINTERGLRAFAADSYDPVGMFSNYMRFIEYWTRRKALSLSEKIMFSPEELELAPIAPAGDAQYWNEYGDVGAAIPPRIKPDVRDRAISALRSIADDVSLEQLRCAGRSRELCAFRRQVIAILWANDYRNGAIARCVNVSPAHVSNVAAAMRAAQRAARIGI